MNKWLRNILKGTSLSAALFVFQACYGMPPGEDPWPMPEDEYQSEIQDIDTPDEEDQAIETEAGNPDEAELQ